MTDQQKRFLPTGDIGSVSDRTIPRLTAGEAQSGAGLTRLQPECEVCVWPPAVSRGVPS